MREYREKASFDWSEDSVRIMATPSAFAKSSLYYAQEAGMFRAHSSYFTERENLDSYLIVYTLSGAGSLVYDDKSFGLQAGQLFYIDCRKYQYYKTASNEPWELIWLHFDGSSSRAYYDRFAAEGSPVLSLEKGSRIPGMMKEIVALHELRTIETELRGSRLIVDLLTELMLAVQQRDTPQLGIPSVVRDVIRHYDRRFAEKLTLDGLSEAFAMDKYALSKTFKKYTGFSPNEYLINVRIARAKERLRYSDMPVAEIAADVGIDNVSHFINLFRERESYTPLAYRKRWQEGRK
ncbi:AraC family transcriptional regulator [Cohnella suwonensis]|uniref:AraC family transcriptional regulator n=1 Tax=Cohnella suwonensis TaxID=696072 RepID=A0ABW0LZT4_9BACL